MAGQTHTTAGIPLSHVVKHIDGTETPVTFAEATIAKLKKLTVAWRDGYCGSGPMLNRSSEPTWEHPLGLPWVLVNKHGRKCWV